MQRTRDALAGFCFMTTRDSLQFDVGSLGELAPLPKLARDQGGEVGRRPADRIDALARRHRGRAREELRRVMTRLARGPHAPRT